MQTDSTLLLTETISLVTQTAEATADLLERTIGSVPQAYVREIRAKGDAIRQGAKKLANPSKQISVRTGSLGKGRELIMDLREIAIRFGGSLRD